MTTRDELKAKYRNKVIPRVAQYNFDHGTDIKPWECVRDDQGTFTTHPRFDKAPENYTFLLTIVDGKPVFEGDVLYFKRCGSCQYAAREGGYVTKGELVEGYDWTTAKAGDWSWTAPPAKKRTFHLNGADYPCPEGNDLASSIQITYMLKDNSGGSCSNTRLFYFKSADESSEVGHALVNLLKDARDQKQS